MFRSSRLVISLIVLLLVLNLAVMAWFGYRWYTGYQYRFLEQAEQALVEGDRATAIRAFSAHVRNHPEDRGTAERLERLRQEYRRRYLKRAEAHLKVGDKVAAIDDYRQHIEHYPGDYDTQLKLAKLYEQLGINDSAESLYRQLIKELDGSGSRLEAVARQRLLRHINEWANGIKRGADRLFREGDFEAAASEYGRVISLRSRNPALFSGDAQSARALSALNNVIAKRAFSLWRAGGADADDMALTSAHDRDVFRDESRSGRPPADVMRQRRIMLSNFFWDYADQLFDREQWRQAGDMYATAREMRAAANNGSDDPNAPTLLFNYALSEYRAGNTGEARHALDRIQRDYPYHEKAAVKQLQEKLGEQ